MEFLEKLQSLLPALISIAALIVTNVFALIKWIKSVKARVKENGLGELLLIIPTLMKEAEKLTEYSGEEKRKYVITRAIEYASNVGIKFDADAVNAEIERLIVLSKSVNARKDA